MVEQSITIGNIIEILVISGGGISVFSAMRTTVRNVNVKVDEMQREIQKLGEILVAQGRFDEKLTGLERRVSMAERKIDEMSHGEGFVRGIARRSIDGEYP